MSITPSPTLHGVHHTARPTWALEETVEFYRDVLGLPLIHAISARGWGREKHPDFLHFFFDSGNGSTIAFFYYIGDEQPDWLKPRDRYDYDAIHTAWHAADRAELMAWKDKLEARGVEVMGEVRHEVIESIYFRDPNGYVLEITCPLRRFAGIDAVDAARTLEAAIEQERRARNGGPVFDSIDPVWHAKALAIETAWEEAK